MGRWLKRAAQITAQYKEQSIIHLAANDGHSEIAWRVDAMRQQVPQHGNIPFPVARSFAWSLEDAWAVVNSIASPRCISCGDPVEGMRQARCSPCAQAMYIVLNEVREGVEHA